MSEPDRPRHEDVGEDDEVGQDRAERNEDGQRRQMYKKTPGRQAPGR